MESVRAYADAAVAPVNAVYGQLVAYEANFSGHAIVAWTQDHAELPIFATALYLAMATYGPRLMPFSLQLGWTFALWNLGLSVFSVLGASRVVPHLLAALQDPAHGESFQERFVWTCCTHPDQWYLHKGPGLWVALFIYSKFPELLDTAFLVLQKKEVIFLHWFHHCTVLLYCWHSFHHTVSAGLWFSAMNYSVHAVMYVASLVARRHNHATSSSDSTIAVQQPTNRSF
jgi:elongation of very long chain fatty acids protein 6